MIEGNTGGAPQTEGAPSNQSEKLILRLEEVSKSFGDLRAVDRVSFAVRESEIFGLAGPNGAGKTTLFNLIAGSLQGTGKIYFNGRNVMGLRPCQICCMGIARTFQIPVLFTTLSVFKNIFVGSRFGHSRRLDSASVMQIVEETIDLVGLQGKEDASAGGLDLYDKKRTMLAAALATKPRILLLDEPAGGLSPGEIKEFVSLIRRINEEVKVTIVIIEHLMQVITGICNRLMILNNGQQVSIGQTKDVMTDSEVIKVYLGDKYARCS